MRIQRRASGSLIQAIDYLVQLIVNGSRTGDNKADTATSWPTSYTNKDYGGETDTWGCSLTPSLVNASNFGVALRVSNGAPFLHQAQVDAIWIKIYYSTGPNPLAAEAGNYAVSGQAAALKVGRAVGATAGAFAHAGQAAALRLDRAVAATAGTFALAGLEAGLLRFRAHRKLDLRLRGVDQIAVRGTIPSITVQVGVTRQLSIRAAPR